VKIAALDLGSNSFLCLVAEVDSGKITKIYSDQVEIVRLGQGVAKTKKFHPDAIERAKACLEKFKKTIVQHSPERILGMATSAARDVENKELLFQIGRELQIPIEIIPGQKEALISYLGSTSGFSDAKPVSVLDIGGGSTEIIVGQSGRVHFGQSADIGAVRLTEMFFTTQPPSEAQIQALRQHTHKILSPIVQEAKAFQPLHLLAVAGTPTELAAASLGGFDQEKIDQFTFTLIDLDKWIKELSQRTPQQRTQDFGISAGRADVILAGTIILHEALSLFGLKSLSVSTRGLRFGVAIEAASRSS
jgi:exopolyphosphatase/guanosine-5'-triphosphate,3'-diphosphate pyrophosphatase